MIESNMSEVQINYSENPEDIQNYKVALNDFHLDVSSLPDLADLIVAESNIPAIKKTLNDVLTAFYRYGLKIKIRLPEHTLARFPAAAMQAQIVTAIVDRVIIDKQLDGDMASNFRDKATGLFDLYLFDQESSQLPISQNPDDRGTL